ncbi:glycosyl hydrolase family 28-related protein [Chryseobacterium hispalense]|uniref:glycosyl hydrolase family 28-related protein n=1 Tax=Chryseobacterium hispalense TaxID=1453492 RepID=UPI000493AFD4|nr:glycosyl hydrolase family 28-related protein [Chryseobacterium hispalense]
MKFKFYLATLIFVFVQSLSAQTNILFVKDYGAIGDGHHDDYLAIQKTFDAAKNTKNSVITFEKGKEYIISKPIKVYSDINGNTSTIIPLSSQAISIISPNLKIENINISGSAFKYIRIDQNNISINNCNLSTDSYFALVVINANSFTLTNSSVKNNFSKERNYALHALKGLQNINIINNKIKGGVIFKNNTSGESGNILFKDNEFTIDYSTLKQDVSLQNDAFTFYSNTKIAFINNKINASNINRLFKISANSSKDKNNVLKITGISPDNIKFENNEINAKSSNGKQLFDFYIGTKGVILNNNKINAKGFATLFENKTKADLERSFSLTNNIINFDSEILYFDGYGKNNTAKNNIEIKNNIFTYDADEFKFISKRAGQSNNVKFNFLFNIRNVDRFIYDHNTLKQTKNNLYFSNRYFFYIQNPLTAEITNSSYIGGIKLIPVRENPAIKTINNLILKSDFKETVVTDKTNKVQYKLIKK